MTTNLAALIMVAGEALYSASSSGSSRGASPSERNVARHPGFRRRRRPWNSVLRRCRPRLAGSSRRPDFTRVPDEPGWQAGSCIGTSAATLEPKKLTCLRRTTFRRESPCGSY